MARYKTKKKAKAQKPKDGEYYVVCKIRLGSIERERGVIIEMPEGNITTIVDELDVLPHSKPEPGVILNGKLKVFVVDQKGDRVIVDLPRETFSSGPRIAVPKELVVAA
jgi:hypothetical protein